MTEEIPKYLKVDNNISFHLRDNMVVINEIDESKDAPYWCEIEIDDWQKIVKFINSENGEKSS